MCNQGYNSLQSTRLYTCSTGEDGSAHRWLILRVTMRHTGVGKACWGPPRIFAPPGQLMLRRIVPLPFSISTIFPLIDNP